MIEAVSDNRIVNRELVYKTITSSKLECHLHCAKPIPSGQRQPKHQLKQLLRGPFYESPGQSANFDASKTNVLRTKSLVFKTVRRSREETVWLPVCRA